MNISTVQQTQAPLRARYKKDATAAQVVDHARTIQSDSNDPFHTAVEPMPGAGVRVPVGVHAALGGPHDAPTPGDILCSALAACADSTIRMIANALGVHLTSLEVTVEADVDVRGTLMVERDVPIGFQAMRCHVRMRVAEKTPAELLERLKLAAEHSCVVLQTLRSPPPVSIAFSAA